MNTRDNDQGIYMSRLHIPRLSVALFSFTFIPKIIIETRCIIIVYQTIIMTHPLFGHQNTLYNKYCRFIHSLKQNNNKTRIIVVVMCWLAGCMVVDRYKFDTEARHLSIVRLSTKFVTYNRFPKTMQRYIRVKYQIIQQNKIRLIFQDNNSVPKEKKRWRSIKKIETRHAHTCKS